MAHTMTPMTETTMTMTTDPPCKENRIDGIVPDRESTRK
jgi:hypothetical protein